MFLFEKKKSFLYYQFSVSLGSVVALDSSNG